VLEDGFIPIFPCIGWSSNGKPYNISSINLAAQVATELKAEKLFLKHLKFKNSLKATLSFTLLYCK
ncbi:MAG: hypothetical protein IKV12_06870, partial [Alistipes sp.]|nr:hypothetical protein [Alistipes sp.]